VSGFDPLSGLRRILYSTSIDGVCSTMGSTSVRTSWLAFITVFFRLRCSQGTQRLVLENFLFDPCPGVVGRWNANRLKSTGVYPVNLPKLDPRPLDCRLPPSRLDGRSLKNIHVI
jgi:hypothetical protein